MKMNYSNMILHGIVLTTSVILHADTLIDTTLDTYKNYLEQGTYTGFDWSHLERIPQSRYYTFKIAFDHFQQYNGKVVVELGTSRSFVHGGHIGCNLDDPAYWNPNKPE